jgi:hypothetical protein
MGRHAGALARTGLEPLHPRRGPGAARHAGAYAAQSFDLVDVLLVAGGAVLLPLWLFWTGRPLRDEEASVSD